MSFEDDRRQENVNKILDSKFNGWFQTQILWSSSVKNWAFVAIPGNIRKLLTSIEASELYSSTFEFRQNIKNF